MNDRPETRSPKSRVVRFLIGYFAVYIVVAVALNISLGPPGMSKDFLSSHKDDYDRYLDITKDPAYKRWSQRPHLNPPDAALAVEIAFMDDFIAFEDFKAEQRRRAQYNMLFDFFNVAMVALLAIHFGRKPIAGFLDAASTKIGADLGRTEEHRNDARTRRWNAANKVNRIAEDEAALQQETECRLDETRGEISAMTEQSLALLSRETEDRKRHEEELALQMVKQDVVDQAIAILSEVFREQRAMGDEAALIDEFVRQTEDAS